MASNGSGVSENSEHACDHKYSLFERHNVSEGQSVHSPTMMYNVKSDENNINAHECKGNDAYGEKRNYVRCQTMTNKHNV